MSGPPTTLFFTAGPHHWLGSSELEVHGGWARLRPGSGYDESAGRDTVLRMIERRIAGAL